jgi:tRNA dimethylallyltransferase
VENRKLIAIVGPTASGKTGVGVKLAKKIGGEIISADSRQIFRKLDIGSGKDIKTYDNVVYHLIDVADPGQRFTLFDWLDQARAAIEDIFSRGKTPIVVGGTGLYVSALTEGYQLTSPKSKVQSHACRQAGPKFSRQKLDGMTLTQLQEIFSGLETQDSGLDTNNPRRLIRAIEKAQSGEEVEKVKPSFESLIIEIDRDREALYKKIDKRADERFKSGMLEEARKLLLCHPRDPKGGEAETLGIQKPLDSCLRRNDKNTIDKKMAGWLISLGLDYKHMTKYLLELQESGSWYKVVGEEQTEKYKKMVEQFKFAEHDYARRQLIWWRKKDIRWAKDYQEVERLADKFLS